MKKKLNGIKIKNMNNDKLIEELQKEMNRLDVIF